MDIGSKDSTTGLLIWAIISVLAMTVMLSVLASMVMDVDILDGIMAHFFGKNA